MKRLRLSWITLRSKLRWLDRWISNKKPQALILPEPEVVFGMTGVFLRLSEAEGQPSRKTAQLPAVVGTRLSAKAKRKLERKMMVKSYLLLTTYYLLLTSYYLLLTTYYLLPTTYYLLLTICHLLPTTYY